MYFNPTASAPKRPFANLRGGLPSPCGADRLVPASRSRLVPAARVSRRPAGNGKAVRGTSPLSSGPRQNNGAHYQPPPNSSPAEPRSPTGAAGVADSPRTTSLKACSKGLLAASAVVFEAPGRAPERIATSVGRSWGVCTRATSSSPPRTLQPRTRTPSPRPQPQSPPKAPEIPMSAAAAAYLALGKAPGESTPSRSERRLRGAGVEQVQQPRPGSARGSATASKDRLAHPMLLNNIGTFGRKLRRSSIVGSGLPPGPATEAAKPLSPPQPGSLSAGRDILERSWSSEEAERRLRAMSSEAATSSTASQEAKQYHAPITSSKPPTSPPQGGKAFRVLRGRRVAQRAPACTIKPHQCVPNSPTLPVDFSSELLCLQNEVWRLKAKVFKSRTDSSRAKWDSVNELVETLGTRVLLEREEEGLLLKLIQRKTELDQMADEMKAKGKVSAEELAALAGLGGGARELAILREMAADSRSIMERCNIRLVVAIARKYHGQRDMDFRDLIHAGLQGLHKAFEKFDTEKGVKFSTYGHWWVRQGISRCLCQESRVVRLPSHVVDNISRIYRAASKLASLRDDDSPPPITDVAAEVNLPAAKVSALLRVATEPLSMEGYAPSVQDKDGEPVLLLDTLTQDDDPEGLLSSSKWMSTDDIQEEAEAQAATREIINRMLSSLSCRERNIIRMHYGLVSSDGTEQTFGEIGEVYELTQERIRQVEDKAMRRLRRQHQQEVRELKRLAR